ncbi:hypothetical protein BD413DRAFT_444851, partial [Trametes elegans]
MNPIVSDSPKQTAAYLRTLPAICECCGSVHELTPKGLLDYFDYHPNKETDAAAFCVSIIKRDFGNDFAAIPPHGRWMHLYGGRPRVQPLIDHWRSSANPPDTKEICRQLINLFLVSVLLDAGAGNAWWFHESSLGQTFSRSEGLGVASIAMFEQGFFSGDAATPINRLTVGIAEGLSRITAPKIASAMKVSDANLIVGLEGRTSLLVNLSKALNANSTYFGNSARPGNLTFSMPAPSPHVHSFALWTALIDGLAWIWPRTRMTLGGVALGDVWPCAALAKHASAPSPAAGNDPILFHKLTGSTTYSLFKPIEKVLGWRLEGL